MSGTPAGRVLRKRCGWSWVVALAGASALSPADADAQIKWRDLHVSGGLSLEGYQGNLAAVSVPQVDSTEAAQAAVGEFAGRGQLWLLEGATRDLWVGFDAGLRQFAATGFEVRDYAPREWVGNVALNFRQDLGASRLMASVRARGRDVADRPPIPLFIQPGYGMATGELRLLLPPARDVSFDVSVGGEISDYTSLVFTPQLDLLDRRAFETELGASWQGTAAWRVRFFSGLDISHYERQGTALPSDPFRRDHAVRAGAQWSYGGSRMDLRLGAEGIFNRSNSRRVEYDALRASVVSGMALPWEITANVYGVFTLKRYLLELETARVAPGEEADNATVAYLLLSRPVAANLDGAIRFGWTRAETDIGDSYFRRYGFSVLLDYRP
ncbi:MAG: hypothetical protein R3E98_15520 [Gemmatimonadota bacterium]